MALIHVFIAQRGAGLRPRNLLVNGNCQGSPSGAFGWVETSLFQGARRFQPRWSDVSEGCLEGDTEWNMVDPAPHLKFKKAFWGTFPFFWNGANQNKQSGISRRKNPRVLKTVFGWWFGGSVVEPISRNYMYHLMLYIHYTSLYIHTITYLVLINLGDLMTKGYQRPRSNQQHTALAHKLFNPKTLHAEVTWKFATLAWQEWASRRSFEDTPWNVLFFLRRY